MTTLTELRLRNQLLLQPPFDAPQQVVEWMGAVQAQDYRMAKWAVGCRTASTDATQIEAALNRGDILRTHLLRPTWHFVSSKDLRWILSLTADRIRAANDSYARGTDAALDSKSIHRYMNLLQKTLEGNKHRTKEEIGEALNQRGIPLSQYALRHLLMRAETDGIVCSGADKKGTTTYALLDERAPRGEEPSREEALARLAESISAATPPPRSPISPGGRDSPRPKPAAPWRASPKNSRPNISATGNFSYSATLRQPLRATRRICCPPTTNT